MIRNNVTLSLSSKIRGFSVKMNSEIWTSIESQFEEHLEINRSILLNKDVWNKLSSVPEWKVISGENI